MKALGSQRDNGWARFISMQSYYNLVYREEEREMVQLCLSEGVGISPWSPLARGYLAGWPAGQPPGRAQLTRRHEQSNRGFLWFANRRGDTDGACGGGGALGQSSAEIATAWLASRPGVAAPIIGLTRIEQFEAAVRAVNIQLDAADVAALEAAYQPRAVSY